MKKKYVAKALAGLLAAGMAVLSAQIPARADNPVVQNAYTADPAPMAYGDTLYLYTSHDEDVTVGDFYTMNDWKCYSTKDMVNWTDHGIVLRYESFEWADTNDPRAWAPQCVERNGKFYIYVPLHKKDGGMVIGVGISDSPEGPFVDAIGEPLVDDGQWNNIDPTVFVDDDGQAYLYFGNPNLRYVQLNEDMLSYDKNIGRLGIVNITMSEESFGKKGQPDRKTSYGEGPWFYKRGNLYYMVYAAFANGGAEHLAYSTSESPTGPWEYRGMIMQSQGLGKTGVCYTNHPGVVDFMGHSYLFYHNQALPNGGSYRRSVCVEEFTYNEDGTFPSDLRMTEEGPDAIAALDPYNRTEAETFAWGNNVKTEPCPQGGINLCDIKNGSSVKVRNVDFGEKGAVKFHASVASEGNKGAAIELHLDSEEGTKIGTLNISDTGGTKNYQTLSTSVSGAVGVHDLYLVFTGEGEEEEELFQFDYWQFEKEPEPEPTVTPEPSPTGQPPANTGIPATATPAPTQTPSPEPQVSDETISVAKVKSLSVKKKKSGKAKITWKKVKKADGYEVVYATDKKLKKGAKKATVKKTAYTVKKLKKGKTYFVKVRAYRNGSNGKKIYGGYSSVKKVKM